MVKKMETTIMGYIGTTVIHILITQATKGKIVLLPIMNLYSLLTAHARIFRTIFSSATYNCTIEMANMRGVTGINLQASVGEWTLQAQQTPNL